MPFTTTPWQPSKGPWNYLNVRWISSLIKWRFRHSYPDLISPHRNTNKDYCGVSNRIDTESHSPVYAKARKLSFVFKTLLNDGAISHSKSEWSGPLHGVATQNGEYSCYGDYRSFNSINRRDRYPKSNINPFSAKLANKKWVSKID